MVTSIANSVEFPNLTDGDFEQTSGEAEHYNCLAWAAGVDSEWWEPSLDGSWPDDIPRDTSPDTLVMLYESLGYERCDNAEHENGFEKIVIYGNSIEYEHAARQLPTGEWTSKLGPGIDIKHATTECIAGGLYGSPLAYLKRRFGETRNERGIRTKKAVKVQQ